MTVSNTAPVAANIAARRAVNQEFRSIRLMMFSSRSDFGLLRPEAAGTLAATVGSAYRSPIGEECYTTDLIRDGSSGSDGHTESGERTRVPFSESKLADRYWDRIRTFAARWLRDSTAAEDVAQETLRRVVDAVRAGRVEQLDALPGFVFQIARHICLQRDRSVMRETRALSRLAEPDGTTAPDALLALISDERCASVRQALARLEHDDRALLRVLYYERLETADVARQLGISAGALRVRKHRALLRLSTLFRGDEP